MKLFGEKETKPSENIDVKLATKPDHLKFIDPDDGNEIIVPLAKIIVGELSYENISKNSYVYDRKNGYLAMEVGNASLMQKLNQEQIELIEASLKSAEKTTLTN